MQRILHCSEKGPMNIKEEVIVQLMPFKMLRSLLLYNKEAFFFHSCLEYSQLKYYKSSGENTIDLRFPSCWQKINLPLFSSEFS